jgi:hypothetical protein
VLRPRGAAIARCPAGNTNDIGRAIVKLRALLLACTAALALGGAASAQSPGPGNGALPPFRIAAMVRAAGFDPLFRPMRQGDTYVLRALDRNEVEYRLVIDAYTGRTISIRATGEPGPYARVYRGGPAYGPAPMYGRVFGPDDDRYGPRYGGPRPPPPQVRPPQTTKATPAPAPAQTQPTQLATPEPNKTNETPLPRPRPYVMEATSSIPADAPKAEPQNTTTPPPTLPPAPQNPAPPAATPQNNGGAAMPPVTPLD